MTVPREEINSPANTLALEVCHAERNENGQWVLVARISGEVQVGDGRSLLVAREVRLRVHQCGRKPHTRRGGP